MQSTIEATSDKYRALPPIEQAPALGSDLARYFQALAVDLKSTSMYFDAVKELGFEKAIRLIASGFCADIGITNKEFKIVLEQLLRMA
jgi:hypothetical protein